MRAYRTTTARIDQRLHEQVRAVVELLDPKPSINAFIETCIREILLLIETKPGERQWPRLVLMVDSARGIQHTPDEVAKDLQRLKSMLEQLLGATKPAAEPVNSTVVQKLVAAVKGGTPAPPAPARSTSPAPARPARTDKDRPA